VLTFVSNGREVLQFSVLAVQLGLLDIQSFRSFLIRLLSYCRSQHNIQLYHSPKSIEFIKFAINHIV